MKRKGRGPDEHNLVRNRKRGTGDDLHRNGQAGPGDGYSLCSTTGRGSWGQSEQVMCGATDGLCQSVSKGLSLSPPRPASKGLVTPIFGRNMESASASAIHRNPAGRGGRAAITRDGLCCGRADFVWRHITHHQEAWASVGQTRPPRPNKASANGGAHPGEVESLGCGLTCLFCATWYR